MWWADKGMQRKQDGPTSQKTDDSAAASPKSAPCSALAASSPLATSGFTAQLFKCISGQETEEMQRSLPSESGKWTKRLLRPTQRIMPFLSCYSPGNFVCSDTWDQEAVSWHLRPSAPHVLICIGNDLTYTVAAKPKCARKRMPVHERPWAS